MKHETWQHAWVAGARSRRFAPRWVVACALALLGLGAFLLANVHAADPLPTALIRIDPQEIKVLSGDNVVVDVVVEDVVGLGAFEFSINYDTTILNLDSFASGLFLGRTGRTVTCMEHAPEPGSIDYGCVTKGASPDPPSGSGVLATFTFSTKNPGEMVLGLKNVGISNVLGEKMPSTDKDAKVKVNGPTETPTDTPTKTPSDTPTDTPTKTPSDTPTKTPTDTPTPTFTWTQPPTWTPVPTWTPGPTWTPPVTITATPTQPTPPSTLTPTQTHPTGTPTPTSGPTITPMPTGTPPFSTATPSPTRPGETATSTPSGATSTPDSGGTPSFTPTPEAQRTPQPPGTPTNTPSSEVEGLPGMGSGRDAPGGGAVNATAAGFGLAIAAVIAWLAFATPSYRPPAFRPTWRSTPSPRREPYKVLQERMLMIIARAERVAAAIQRRGLRTADREGPSPQAHES